MNIKIGEIIENARRAKGLTQGQLAKKLGVSNTAISKWEHGYNLPDIALLEPISKTLDIDVMHLLQLENATKEDTSSKNKNKKIKSFINIILCILLFLSTISFVALSVSNHYKKKIDKIKSEQLQAYRFQSVDDEFAINGYILFKNKENRIIFENIVYQNKSRRNANEKYNSVELQMFVGDERIIYKKHNTIDSNRASIENILNSLLLTSQHQFDLTVDCFENVTISIKFENDTEILTKNIKIEFQAVI